MRDMGLPGIDRAVPRTQERVSEKGDWTLQAAFILLIIPTQQRLLLLTGVPVGDRGSGLHTILLE